jgi:hypothetical protein
MWNRITMATEGPAVPLQGSGPKETVCLIATFYMAELTEGGELKLTLHNV